MLMTILRNLDDYNSRYIPQKTKPKLGRELICLQLFFPPFAKIQEIILYMSYAKILCVLKFYVGLANLSIYNKFEHLLEKIFEVCFLDAIFTYFLSHMRATCHIFLSR